MKTALHPAPAGTAVHAPIPDPTPAPSPKLTAPGPVASLHAIPAPRSVTVKAKNWASPGTSTSPAYISLSRDHVAVLKSPDGRLLTPIDLGRMELSTQQAWDTAADTLLRTQTGQIEFTVRNASFALGDIAPRGLEVQGTSHPAAAWLAHPRTFKVLHAHFTEILSPAKGLVFFSRDHEELFVFDAHAADVRVIYPDAAVMTYSLGFPVSPSVPAAAVPQQRSKAQKVKDR